jgi:hypothetical protein
VVTTVGSSSDAVLVMKHVTPPVPGTPSPGGAAAPAVGTGTPGATGAPALTPTP